MRADSSRRRERLDETLRAAALDGDAQALMKAYEAAADLGLTDGHTDAAAFFLTHAYVWALVAGTGAADLLAVRLRQLGRLELDDMPLGNDW